MGMCAERGWCGVGWWSFAPSTKIAITKQKIDFWPQISKFWGQKSAFSPLAANWSLADQCFQHEKGVSLESRYEGTKIFTPCPQKIGFWAQKWPNLVQNLHFWSFWAKYCHFLHLLSIPTVRENYFHLTSQIKSFWHQLLRNLTIGFW